MRVTHIVPNIAKEASGPTYVGLRLCAALKPIGVSTTLAGLTDTAGQAAPTGVLLFPRGRGPQRWGRSPALQAWLNQQLRAQQVDLLHSHGLWMSVNTQSLRAARQAKRPVVVSPHGSLSTWAMQSGSWAKKLAWPLSLRPALRYVNGFHATALSELEEIRHWGFRQPVAVVPLGIESPPESASAPRAGKPRTLLFLGRIHPKKGLPILLAAWHELHSEFPQWQIRVVGPDDGGHLAEVQALARQWCLPRIEFSGPALGLEKWQAYREAELFVLPTHSENFAVAVAEALATGIPAIVSHGAPWAGLEQHQAGWWIATNTDAWIGCLRQVLKLPPDALRAHGARGRAWMQAAFTWEATARQMLAAYRYFLGQGDKPECVVLD
jgi:glycosyltransferase involved in cell wall biosynthesis